MICNTNVQQHKRQVLQAEDICCSTCLCTTLSISREGGKIMCSTLGNLQKRMCAWCESLIALGLSSVGLRPSSSAPRESSGKLGCRLASWLRLALPRLGIIQTRLDYPLAASSVGLPLPLSHLGIAQASLAAALLLRASAIFKQV